MHFLRHNVGAGAFAIDVAFARILSVLAVAIVLVVMATFRRLSDRRALLARMRMLSW